MPVVTVQLYAGKTKEQKANMAKAITEAMSEHGNIPKEAVVVIFQDVPKDSWAHGGQLAET